MSNRKNHPEKYSRRAKHVTAAVLMTAAMCTAGGQPNPGGGPAAKPQPYTLSGIYTLSGKADKSTAQPYTSNARDVSAIYVKSSGNLTLTDPNVTTTGDSSSEDNSNYCGLNAAVLAGKGSKIKVTGGSISTAGIGATAVTAAGAGASIMMSKTSINTAGAGGRGVTVNGGGDVTITDVTISTTAAGAVGIATDRGGGTIIITGGTVNTTGDASPALLCNNASNGSIKANGSTMTAAGAEVAIVEGSGSITLTDSNLTSSKGRGVMMYQNTSTASPVVPQSGHGTFAMKNGSLTANDGPVFYVTNDNATVYLTGVTINASSGKLIDASAGKFGVSGYNGGTLQFTADHEILSGDITADETSKVSVALQNRTTLSATVKNAAVSLDASSIWTVTADSTISTFTDNGGMANRIVSNIVGGGHDVHYDASLSGNRWLNSRTYELASGGHLLPIAGTAKSSNQNNNQNGNNNGQNGNNNGSNNGGSGRGGGGHR